MGLASTIQRLGTGSYTITREGLGSYGTDGKYVHATPTTITSNCVAQPGLHGEKRTLQVLPEGTHQEDVQNFITPDFLQSQPIPDIIVFNGDNYFVFRCDGPFVLNGFSHYEVYAARNMVP